MKVTQKQKILSLILVLTLAVLIWQAYGFFTESNSVAVLKSQPDKHKNMATIVLPPPSALPTNINPVVVNTHNNNAASTETDLTALTDTQKAYLQLVSEYKLTQLQRMIAENNQAIAEAKLKVAQAQTSMGAFIVKDDIATTKVGGSGKLDDYELMYTGQEDGQWAATLKNGMQSYDVEVGTVLGHGARVIAIDKNGVTLQQGSAKVLVSFDGIIAINDNVAAKPKLDNHSIAGKLQSEEKTQLQTGVIEAAPVVVTPSITAPIVKVPAATKPLVSPSSATAMAKKSAVPVIPPLIKTLLMLEDKSGLEVANKTSASAAVTEKSVSTVIAPTTANVSKSAAQVTTIAPIPVTSAAQLAKVDTSKSVPAIINQPVATPNKADLNLTGKLDTLSRVTPINSNKPIVNNSVVNVVTSKASTQVSTNNIAKPVVSSVATTNNYTVVENQLLKINSANYTVQLATVSDLKNLKNFVISNNLGYAAAYYQTQIADGSKRYVLIYGNYPNRAAAQKAIDELSEQTGLEDGVVKSYATVQADIKHNHNT